MQCLPIIMYAVCVESAGVAALAYSIPAAPAHTGEGSAQINMNEDKVLSRLRVDCLRKQELSLA